MKRLLVTAVALVSVRAIACPFCGGGAFGRPTADDAAGEMTGESPSTMVITIRDNMKGTERLVRGQDVPVGLDVPYGFKCQVDKTIREVNAATSESADVFTLTCTRGAEKASIEHFCTSGQSEKRWDGADKTGLNVVSVLLRCV